MCSCVNATAEVYIATMWRQQLTCSRVAVTGVLQAFLTLHETHVIERSIAREEKLMNEQQELEAEVTELGRLAVIKV